MKDTAEKVDITFFPAQGGGGGGGGGYGCARAILVVGVLLCALLISGCHKDSFDFDEFTRPTAATPDDGTELPSSTRTPNIAIFPPAAAVQEGDAVVLMITSDADAPADGLVVMINIGGAMDGEFTANAPATCTTNLVCTVRILEGNRAVNLVLMPTSDSAVENSERWTASLVDGGSNYNLAAGNDNVVFDITDPPVVPPTPNIGISSTDSTAQEGSEQVVLMITSDIVAPAGGLSVTIRISGATDGEFTTNPPSVCTNLVCIVDIPAGSDSVNLVLIPTSDAAAETSENWTATLVDGSNYNLDASNNNVAFDITDPPTPDPMMPNLPEVSIATSDSAMEGNAVVLTITSSIAAPTGGLTVTINIGVADATEFTSGTPSQCNGIVCEVVIAATEMTAFLTLTALSGDEAENVEMWTATIVGDGTDYTLDPLATTDTFDITNLPLPARANNLMLSALDDYDSPTPLAADAIRAGEDNQIAADAITGFQYNDADGNPQVYVQLLTHAHLGIWTNGQVPTVITSPTATASDFDHDFRYAFLGDNAVNPPATTDGRGDAIYNLEGDATYKGVNFFPGGLLTMHFDAGDFEGILAALGGGAVSNPNAFGDINAMLPDVNDLDGDGDITDLRVAGFLDFLRMDINGMITGDGFESTSINLAFSTGFFDDLTSVTSSSLTGRFYNAAGYDPSTAAPTEMAGVVETNIGGGADELNMGFLGRIQP